MGNDDVENPLLPAAAAATSPRRRRSARYVLHMQALVYFIIYAAVILSAVAVFLWTGIGIAANNNKIHSFQPVNVLVSSFNISSENPNFPPIWKSKMSLAYAGVTNKDYDVFYDAEATLYFRNGFSSTVHVASPSSIYVSDDQEALHVEANFTVDAARIDDREVAVDLSIEADSKERPNTHISYIEITSFVTIHCNDLRIEFSESPRLGKLSSGGDGCRTQRCASRVDALHGNKKRCRVFSDFNYM